MRKLLALTIFASIAAASQAIVFPVGPFAPTSVDTFDTYAAGGFLAHPVFAGLGVAQAIGSGGALVIGPPSPFLSGPNGMFGRGVDVNIKINGQRRRFGGGFRNVLAGIVPATTVKFKFYDVTNTLIGTATAPLTAAWTWRGYITVPKWTRVEIYGNAGLPGYVAMDNLRLN